MNTKKIGMLAVLAVLTLAIGASFAVASTWTETQTNTPVSGTLSVQSGKYLTVKVYMKDTDFLTKIVDGQPMMTRTGFFVKLLDGNGNVIPQLGTTNYIVVDSTGTVSRTFRISLPVGRYRDVKIWMDDPRDQHDVVSVPVWFSITKRL